MCNVIKTCGINITSIGLFLAFVLFSVVGTEAALVNKNRERDNQVTYIVPLKAAI